MSRTTPAEAVPPTVAILGAAYLTAGSASLLSDPGAGTAHYAVLGAALLSAWVGVAGIARDRAGVAAVGLVGLAALGALNHLLWQFLLPDVAALAVALVLVLAR